MRAAKACNPALAHLRQDIEPGGHIAHRTGNGGRHQRGFTRRGECIPALNRITGGISQRQFPQCETVLHRVQLPDHGKPPPKRHRLHA